ncbi:formylglycine-generating enzyme family protein [candidate division KSB1 bacterium]|nr:formylglycine-generating enzyme family protein [candidate division KSB1 bacterium]
MQKTLSILKAVLIIFLIISGFACDGNMEKKDMVLVAAGEFTMGRDDIEADEKPAHPVYLDAYFIDKYEVTNAQYAAFLNDYGSDKVRAGEYFGQTMIYEHSRGVQKAGGQWSAAGGCEDCPVVCVTWYGANEYALYYGKQLPTEAQWEKAARGGKKTMGYTYSGSNNPDEVGWYDANSDNITHPVGQKQANELGLFDMSGNVWEWCSDWFDAGFYTNSPDNNPHGPVKGAGRVIRGGSWDVVEEVCRTTGRYWDYPENWSDSYGFRCVRNK